MVASSGGSAALLTGSGERLTRAGDGIQDVMQWRRGGRLPSKDADGGRLDPLFEHRVKAVARHDVGVAADDRVDRIPDAHQLDELHLGLS